MLSLKKGFISIQVFNIFLKSCFLQPHKYTFHHEFYELRDIVKDEICRWWLYNDIFPPHLFVWWYNA